MSQVRPKPEKGKRASWKGMTKEESEAFHESLHPTYGQWRERIRKERKQRLKSHKPNGG